MRREPGTTPQPELAGSPGLADAATLATAKDVCPDCWNRYRGARPPGFGDDPVCAFPRGERFSHENWQCAALDPLRELIGEHPGAVEREGITVVANWDQKAALVVVHDGIDLGEDYDGFAVALAVTWYKRRGRTDAAWLLFDDGTALAPTYADVRAICEGYALSDAAAKPRAEPDRSPSPGRSSTPLTQGEKP
jgi:hypothetical protein